MNRFDRIFFSRYVDPSDTIDQVFHRHILVILEDILVWVFFGLAVPGVLYVYDAFGLQSGLASWQVSGWVVLMYLVLMYKLCDWYYDVWIATDRVMVDVRWKWFAVSRLYIPYDRIEGVEIRTRSAIHAFFGVSDVIIRLAGEDRFTLHSAAESDQILSYVRGVGGSRQTHEDHGEGGGEVRDREPFEVLVETLSDVVKRQLTQGERDYVTKSYLHKLSTVVGEEDTIDLRRLEEKQEIEDWKKRIGDGDIIDLVDGPTHLQVHHH